jgi:hypothetical protein
MEKRGIRKIRWHLPIGGTLLSRLRSRPGQFGFGPLPMNHKWALATPPGFASRVWATGRFD